MGPPEHHLCFPNNINIHSNQGSHSVAGKIRVNKVMVGALVLPVAMLNGTIW